MKPKNSIGRIGGILILFLLIHAIPGWKRWRSSQGLAAYQAGSYGEQLARYEGLEGKNMPFNRGTAYYKSEQWSEAYATRKPWSDSCKGNLCRQVRYNLGNTRFREGMNSVLVDEKRALREEAVRFYEQVLKKEKYDYAQHNKEVVEEMLRRLEENPEELPPIDHESEPLPEESEQPQSDEVSEQDRQSDEQQDDEVSSPSQPVTGKEESVADESKSLQGGSDQSENGQNEGEQVPEETRGNETNTNKNDDAVISEQETEQALTPNQKAQIDAYQDFLEEQQYRAQPYFNKQLPQDGGGAVDLFDLFFGGKRFEDQLPGTNGKKDR